MSNEPIKLPGVIELSQESIDKLRYAICYELGNHVNKMTDDHIRSLGIFLIKLNTFILNHRLRKKEDTLDSKEEIK